MALAAERLNCWRRSFLGWKIAQLVKSLHEIKVQPPESTFKNKKTTVGQKDDLAEKSTYHKLDKLSHISSMVEGENWFPNAVLRALHTCTHSYTHTSKWVGFFNGHFVVVAVVVLGKWSQVDLWGPSPWGKFQGCKRHCLKREGVAPEEPHLFSGPCVFLFFHIPECPLLFYVALSLSSEAHRATVGPSSWTSQPPST